MMVSSENKYTQMQRDFYDSTADIMAIDNHRGHDSNPDYYGLLLSEPKNNPENWSGKKALDFGCGIGRNVDNLSRLAEWSGVDGCDISSENIIRADKFLSTINSNIKNNLYVTTGIDLLPIESDQYDFVMATIVFQHIAVRSIRLSIMKDIYRVMKNDSLFTFQMAIYNRQYIPCAEYFEEAIDAPGTNGMYDVSIDNPEDLLTDLTTIGFSDFEVTIRPEWDAYNGVYMDVNRSQWIYVKTWKK